MLRGYWIASLVMLFGGFATSARAGYFELSANGSYYRYDNGAIESKQNITTVKRWGAGLAYRFMQNTAIELSYSNSHNLDDFAYYDMSSDETIYVKRANRYQNLSLNLVLEFAEKRAAFRPFVRGGGGVMKRESTTTGEAVHRFNGVVRTPEFTLSPPTTSASAEAGVGFKVFVSNSTAIELALTVFATDLDKPDIFLHYAATGALRFIFQ